MKRVARNFQVTRFRGILGAQDSPSPALCQPTSPTNSSSTLFLSPFPPIVHLPVPLAVTITAPPHSPLYHHLLLVLSSRLAAMAVPDYELVYCLDGLH